MPEEKTVSSDFRVVPQNNISPVFAVFFNLFIKIVVTLQRFLSSNCQ
jgi:hypothetical protein